MIGVVWGRDLLHDRFGPSFRKTTPLITNSKWKYEYINLFSTPQKKKKLPLETGGVYIHTLITPARQTKEEVSSTLQRHFPNHPE